MAGGADRDCTGHIGELAGTVAVPFAIALLSGQIAEYMSKFGSVDKVKAQRRSRVGIDSRRVLIAGPDTEGQVLSAKLPCRGIERDTVQADRIGGDRGGFVAVSDDRARLAVRYQHFNIIDRLIRRPAFLRQGQYSQCLRRIRGPNFASSVVGVGSTAGLQGLGPVREVVFTVCLCEQGCAYESGCNK